MRPLRVLVLHNRYVSAVPSGENVVVDQEIDLLRRRGMDVATMIRSSDELESWSAARRARLAVTAIWSRESARELATVVEHHKSDLISLHNPYPLLSASVVSTATRLGVPVVQTLHNYRHACMKGTLYRSGAPCEQCVGRRVPLPGVVHGCYRGSRAQSAVMATAQAANLPIWQRDVARYLTLTEFMADRLARHGLPRERMTLRPQAAADPGEPAPLGRGVLYVGRLDTEKGIDLLLDAWRAARPPAEHAQLTIVGDGPLAGDVRDVDGVRWLGRLDAAGVQRALRECCVVVIPSRWYEGLPVVAVEAMAAGRPLLVTAGGALPEVVGDAGVTAPPLAGELADALTSMLGSRERLEQLGGNARARYLAKHTDARLGEVLEHTYSSLRRAAT